VLPPLVFGEHLHYRLDSNRVTLVLQRVTLAQNESSQINLSPLGILLVDDQKAARLLLRAFLTRLGVGRVEEASDSIVALRLLMNTPSSHQAFAAAFVSRSMREMTGLELVRNIRQLAEWSDFPIVIVSEDPDPSLVRDAIAAGATDYILRPYSQETLLATLKRALKYDPIL
jgi:two-component system, chemotaxis family, chemotaxis protein CheY